VQECVGAIIVRNGEWVLLGRRSADRESYPNVWDVFGGHVEPGESHRQCLERELREELGIAVTHAYYLDTARMPGLEGDDTEYSLYVVTGWTGTPMNRQPQEHSEIRWFRIEETRHLELAAREYARLIEGVAGRR
jgi:mutator protein MutT